MSTPYLACISLVERLHHNFLEVIKQELDRRGLYDVNNVQALILFNVGEEEMTVGELTLRGCYLGSNVSYNVKKLVEHGYLVHERSQVDKRTVRVRLTEKGRALCRDLSVLFDHQERQLADSGIKLEALAAANGTLDRLDRYWTLALQLGMRGLVSLRQAA